MMDASPISLADLPVESLKLISRYLPKPSAALFAVALTAPSESWYCNWWRQPWEGTIAIVDGWGQDSLMAEDDIISEQSDDDDDASIHHEDKCWETLDFEDIEEHVAKRLTDDDINAILLCTDAFHHLKRLKLAGCTNITGSGLESLRGSTTLQQLDISMTRQHESPTAKPKNLICEEIVIPIIESIIDAEGNSFQQLQLHPRNIFVSDAKNIRVQTRYKCRYDFDSGVSVRVNTNTMLRKFNQLLRSRGPFACSGRNCINSCPGIGKNGNGDWFESLTSELAVRAGNALYWRGDLAMIGLEVLTGLRRWQKFTCYSCLRTFCEKSSSHCDNCNRNYCFDCVQNKKCKSCHQTFCTECGMLKKCGKCDELFCHDCELTCGSCSKTSCHGCSDPYMYNCFEANCNATTCVGCTRFYRDAPRSHYSHDSYVQDCDSSLCVQACEKCLSSKNKELQELCRRFQKKEYAKDCEMSLCVQMCEKCYFKDDEGDGMKCYDCRLWKYEGCHEKIWDDETMCTDCADMVLDLEGKPCPRNHVTNDDF